MLTLYSYPDLFGVADNNPYGLKVYAFLKLCKLGFRHEHILDTKDAPRRQLPYLQDGDETIGESDAIITDLIARYALPIDDVLTESQRNTDHLIRRMLDVLYWVMSYSRWKDERFWPLFRDALLRTHPGITEAALEAARVYNFKRYQYQGMGRYERDEVYAGGGGSRTCKSWRTSFLRAVSCLGQSQAAVTWPSTILLPICIFTRSTRH